MDFSYSWSHTETWNLEFVSFLLDLVENPLEDDEDERLLDCALSVILAFNYHFLGKTSTILLSNVEHGNLPSK